MAMRYCVSGLLLALSLPAVRAGEAKELESLWKDLADADASRAYAAMWAFVRTPDKSIAFFQTHLKPAVPPERKMVEQLIEELGHEKFAVRAKANGALEKLGDLVAGPLPDALRREQLVLEASQPREQLING